MVALEAALQVSLGALTVVSGIVHADVLISGLVAVITGLVLLVLLVLRVPGVDPVVGSLSATLAIVVIFLLLPALCGLVLARRRRAVRRLAERNAWLERVHSLTAAQARLEERARIAGEVHDVLGHRLNLLSVHAGALASERDVRSIVDHWRAAGADVSVVWEDDGGESLDPRVRRAVDRVVREGLINAHRHAPSTAVLVSVHRTRRRVRVSVRSTAPARGTTPGPGTRVGLVGLTERAGLLGGHATWGTVECGGLELVVQVPSQPSGAPNLGPAGVIDPVTPAPNPPRVQETDVLTWRRVALLVVLGAAFAVPLAATLRLVVVAEASDGPAAVRACRGGAVDVALLDVRMPGGGLAAAERIAGVCPSASLVMLTTFDDEDALTAALRSGAVGFLVTDTGPRELVHAVRAAHRGEQVLAPQVTRRLVRTHRSTTGGRTPQIV